MYQEKLVIAVKANGKVLREHKDLVYVPFGTEYSILIKNKNSVRAMVRVEIDGQDATEGTSLIVPANGSVDLERFIKSGNLQKGNRFKFIERTKKIENGPRGVGAEDGLIRVEFEFEREPVKVSYEEIKRTYIDQYRTWPTLIGTYHYPDYTLTCSAGPAEAKLAGHSVSHQAYSSVSGDILMSTNAASGTIASAVASSEIPMNTAYMASAQVSNTFEPLVQKAAEVNEVGITVPGSLSEQKFVQGSWFPTDGVKHVMILRMLGQVGEKVVTEPVTVKAKPTCVSCGTVNKANAKFCRECGTALTIV